MERSGARCWRTRAIGLTHCMPAHSCSEVEGGEVDFREGQVERLAWAGRFAGGDPSPIGCDQPELESRWP